MMMMMMMMMNLDDDDDELLDVALSADEAGLRSSFVH